MLNNIGSLVGGKVLEAVKLLGGVHKEIEEINEQLETIQFDINGADRMYASTEQEKKGDNGMKRKVKDLREVALRIEDVSEDYMIFQQQQQPQNDLGCIAVLYAAANFFKTIIPRLRICYEIQDIKTRIREVNERPGLQIQPFLGQGSQHTLRRNALYVEEYDVVGFEAPKNELIDWLNETQPKRTVIIVVGMGGQGKTTLAKIVYDKVMSDFDCHAWITVSQTYNIEDVMRTILKKLNENIHNVSEMNLESLTNEARKYLSQKRYVIFFDDVWSKDFWSEIESAMLDDKNRSRIIITTRDMEVANFCKKSSFHIHNLQYLSSQESMKLFCKKAFQNEPDGICPTGLEEISSKIVAKCKGLPLAIVAIGSLIACTGKNSLELQRLCKALIYELDKNPNSTGITNILGLSYDALSYRLKSCFMYFGIYPEDCEVNSKRLIRQWIAEGFVKSNERYETLEEVADQYLQELIQRNLVQVSSFSMNGKPKGCHVHDLLHDMILMKIKDLGFCHFFGDDHSMISGKILRLQIPYDLNANHLKDDITKMSFIRSIHSLGYKDLSEDFLGMILLKSTRLKLLDITNISPNHIAPGNFIHLRYLRFESSVNFDLANSICKMQNLETLDLRESKKLCPMEINKLKKLRHLHTSEPMIVMGGVRGLESLQTLSRVDAKEWEEELFEELKELKQLRWLGLFEVNPKYMRNLCYSINNLQHLERLRIYVMGSMDLDCISPLPTLQKLKLRGGLERFEEWIPKHRNLVKLTLYWSNLSDDPMKSLMHLPNLLSLVLVTAYEGEALHFINGGFQKLKKLHLLNLRNLKFIHIGEGALSSLKVLDLGSNYKLEEVPYGMDQLGKLQVLYVAMMPEVFTIRIKENVWINKNVPNVIYRWKACQVNLLIE